MFARTRALSGTPFFTIYISVTHSCCMTRARVTRKNVSDRYYLGNMDNKTRGRRLHWLAGWLAGLGGACVGVLSRTGSRLVMASWK